eukprot:10812347-Prorocentrum_lima.AAC.1
MAASCNAVEADDGATRVDVTGPVMRSLHCLLVLVPEELLLWLLRSYSYCYGEGSGASGRL